MYLVLVVLMTLIAVPAHAENAQVEGTVQGFFCVTMGKTCPVGKEDPVIAAEKVFVVLADDEEYFFIPNLDRAIMARHINERVRVTGSLNEKFQSINAESFSVYSDGTWRTTWSNEMAQDAIKMIRTPGGF
jgi:hypothetical protein